jgi:hypothetical protein
MSRLVGSAVVCFFLLGASGVSAAIPSDRELEDLWTELASTDPIKAHQAITTLVARAPQSVPFLRNKVRPVPPADPLRLTRLIEDLDSSRFAVRRSATHELESLGELAGPSLRKALAARPSSETCRRIEQILKVHKTRRVYPLPDQLRLARTVEVLEQIGNAAARKELAALAQGASEVMLTRDAKGALERLSQRPLSTP